jgi:hypothetical protein
MHYWTLTSGNVSKIIMMTGSDFKWIVFQIMLFARPCAKYQWLSICCTHHCIIWVAYTASIIRYCICHALASKSLCMCFTEWLSKVIKNDGEGEGERERVNWYTQYTSIPYNYIYIILYIIYFLIYIYYILYIIYLHIFDLLLYIVIICHYASTEWDPVGPFGGAPHPRPEERCGAAPRCSHRAPRETPHRGEIDKIKKKM